MGRIIQIKQKPKEKACFQESLWNTVEHPEAWLVYFHIHNLFSRRIWNNFTSNLWVFQLIQEITESGTLKGMVQYINSVLAKR